MRYAVVMTYPDGERVILARTRRYNGAINEMDLHVESKRVQLNQRRTINGDRVVVGPDTLRDRELDVAVVVMFGVDYTAAYRYAVEPDRL